LSVHLSRRVTFLGLLLGVAVGLAGARASAAPAPLDEALAEVPHAAASFMRDPVFEGDRIYVVTAGPEGAGPPLVLVHGLGEGGLRDFSPILTDLARKRRVVTFDLPGFGRSSRSNQRYAPDRYATVLSRVIAAHAQGPVDVVGHSMGAAIAIAHAGAHRAQVRRLIHVDAAGVLQRDAFVGQMVRGRTEVTAGFLPDLSQLVRDTTSVLVDQAHKLDPAPELVLAAAPLRKLILRGDPTRIAAFSLILHNFGPALSRIVAPTLIVWGKEDSVAPLRTGVALASRIKGSELVTLEGVGHVPMVDAPSVLLGLIERHLAGEVAPAPAAPPPAGESQGNGRCQGQSGMRFSGVYDRLEIEGCEDVQLDGVLVGRLVLKQSKVTISRSTIRSGILAESSEVIMTGGRVAGVVGLEVQDSRVDLAGVAIEAAQQAERLTGVSRVLYSVCPVTTSGRLTHAHGVKSSER
jgi:pimeloyl-ACP methyl ester carboxylesterase